MFFLRSQPNATNRKLILLEQFFVIMVDYSFSGYTLDWNENTTQPVHLYKNVHTGEVVLATVW